MAQFGAGPELAAQCPRVPTPDGWRPWIDADGPIPEALMQRAKALVADDSLPLGMTESYPLPGVTTLIRIEPSTWKRGESGELMQGCFRTSGVYLPDTSPSAVGITAPQSGTNKMITGLTVVSLSVGIAATVHSLRKKK